MRTFLPVGFCLSSFEVSSSSNILNPPQYINITDPSSSSFQAPSNCAPLSINTLKVFSFPLLLTRTGLCQCQEEKSSGARTLCGWDPGRTSRVPELLMPLPLVLRSHACFMRCSCSHIRVSWPYEIVPEILMPLPLVSQESCSLYAVQRSHVSLLVWHISALVAMLASRTDVSMPVKHFTYPTTP